MRAIVLFATTLLMSLHAAAGEVRGTVTSGRKNAGGIVVYVVQAPGTFSPSQEPLVAPVVDQYRREFFPFVLPVLAGTTVTFKNSDTIKHNVFSPEGDFDLGTWPPGETRSWTFTKPNLYRLLCHLHGEMEGNVLVLQNPYFAITKDDGTYAIQGVPDGVYTIKAFGRTVSSKQTMAREFRVVVSGATTLDMSF